MVQRCIFRGNTSEGSDLNPPMAEQRPFIGNYRFRYLDEVDTDSIEKTRDAIGLAERRVMRSFGRWFNRDVPASIQDEDMRNSIDAR